MDWMGPWNVNHGPEWIMDWIALWIGLCGLDWARVYYGLDTWTEVDCGNWTGVDCELVWTIYWTMDWSIPKLWTEPCTGGLELNMDWSGP